MTGAPGSAIRLAPAFSPNLMDLSIVIVSYKVKDLLRDCLQSVYENREGLDLEIVVVDNGSEDGSAEMVRESFPQAKVIENRQNLGFARANNQGALQSSGRNILFLNPDTAILGDVLRTTVEYADQHPEAGVVGCKILNPDGSLQPSCRSFPSLLNYFFESTFLCKIFPTSRFAGSFYMSHFTYDDTKAVDVVLGAFLLVRREIFEEMGRFDESFFIYSEETDLCYRVKKAGRKVLFFAGAEITHYGGSSTSQDSTRMVQQDHRSRFLFMCKHYGALTAWLSVIIIFLGVILRSVLWSLTTVYCLVFDGKRLAGARKKMLTFGSLVGWYLRLGFKKEVYPQARKIG